MAHIDLGLDERRFPGIIGLRMFRPDTAKPLNELADVLLHAPNTLSPGERELIAAYVSSGNECQYCREAHKAFAAVQLDGGRPLVDEACADPDTADIPPKLRALLHIAAAVRVDGRSVTPQMVAAARAEGATDVEIHDTVLIAAAFSMYNRYVDGLATALPDDPGMFEERAIRIAAEGYRGPGPIKDGAQTD